MLPRIPSALLDELKKSVIGKVSTSLAASPECCKAVRRLSMCCITSRAITMRIPLRFSDAAACWEIVQGSSPAISCKQSFYHLHWQEIFEVCDIVKGSLSKLHDRSKKHSIDLTVQAMKHLTIRRPLTANRLDFFPQAETFAAMVKLEFVLIPGVLYK